MTSKLLKHSLRKISSSFKRFLSLLCMSLLGVGFFAGIQATSPDMLKTLDKFYDEQKVYDIEIISTLGLTDNDIDALKDLSLENVIGTYTKDTFIHFNDKEYIVKIMGLNDINKPYLIEGKLPIGDAEIAFETKFLTHNNLKIGDTFVSDNKEYKITGTVISPLYFSTDRGTTNLGNQSVDYYAYMDETAIKSDYYTNIYIKIDNKEITNSNKYNNLIKEVKTKIETIKNSRESKRFDEVYGAFLNIPNIDKSSFVESKWFILDRNNNTGYKDLIDASSNIKKLGTVFPIVFFIIAILISLISMKRMVEEDRCENGTLKALGFNSFQITMKYVIYSLSATLLGGLIGMIIGFNLIPTVIWNIYKMLFFIPNFVPLLDFRFGLFGLVICALCITGTAIFVSFKNLNKCPAVLMRPKSPKIGKKILLERVKFIWNKLKFSNKITLRNLFRYKGRVCTTIIGIAGCTALILSGFGLKDSLKDIANYQFNKVFHYDKMVSLKENKDYNLLLNKLKESEDVKDVVPVSMENISIKYKDETKTAILMVPNDDNELKNVVSLNDINSHKEIDVFSDGIIISEKLAELLMVKINDEVVLLDSNSREYKVKVKAIVQNYVNHYIFMSKELYINLFKEYEPNTFLLNINNDTFNEMLLQDESIGTIINTKKIIKDVENMMNKLNSVVIILIVASALLALVILYNLSNINISERKREIATLKVLGFYNKEVDNYVTKENIILTIIGIFIGLYLGLYLCHYIISTCEPDYIMFVRHINRNSYIMAALITTIFTIFVNIATHFNLKRINMIESLKNVE